MEYISRLPDKQIKLCLKYVPHHKTFYWVFKYEHFQHDL